MNNINKKRKRAMLKEPVKAKEREIKRLNRVPIPKPAPKTSFTATTVGLAKRESGKYRSRWAETAYENATARRAAKNE